MNSFLFKVQYVSIYVSHIYLVFVSVFLTFSSPNYMLMCRGQAVVIDIKAPPSLSFYTLNITTLLNFKKRDARSTLYTAPVNFKGSVLLYTDNRVAITLVDFNESPFPLKTLLDKYFPSVNI